MTSRSIPAATSKSTLSPLAGTSKSKLRPPAGTSKSKLSPPTGTSKSKELKFAPMFPFKVAETRRELGDENKCPCKFPFAPKYKSSFLRINLHEI